MMKLSRKKIIAREFLILLTCVLASTIAFLGTYPYNGAIDSRITKMEKEIEPLKSKADSLTDKISVKQEKQEWFFNENVDRYGPDIGYATYTDLWNRLEEVQKADSIVYKWNNLWSSDLIKIIKEIGFKDGKEFNQFVAKYSLTDKEIQDKSKADPITNEIKNIESKIRTENYKLMNFDDRLEFSLICLIIFGVLAFPLRYLFYSIKWSIKTLKQKEQ